MLKLKYNLISTSVLISSLLAVTPITNVAAVRQSRSALAKYDIKKYRLVNNQNHYLPAYPFSQVPDYQKSVFQTNPDQLNAVAGHSQTNASFQTSYFLPVSFNKSGDFGNPQSAVIVNHYAYIMYTLTGGSNTGFVVRYDLTQLDQLGVTKPGQMDLLRRASWDQIIHKIKNNDQPILNAIRVGPTFNTGHGQSLAYNTKTREMWFVQNTGSHAAVQKLDMDSLSPLKKINFSLGPNVPMGENLAFDKDGNAYFFSYASGGNVAKGAVKLYQGRITNNGVHFKLIMQGIRHAPGPVDQSLGYNPITNKLYLIANGSITSLPVNKLGHLKPNDVKTTNFDQHREFEALAFDQSGNGYLLVNRGPELMKLNGDL